MEREIKMPKIKKGLEVEIQKYDFFDIFETDYPRKHLKPKRMVSLNGVLLRPILTIPRGVTIEGTNLFDYMDCRLGGIEREDGVFVLKEAYPPK